MTTSLTRTWLRRIASYEAGTPIEKSKIRAFRTLVCRPGYLSELEPTLAAKVQSLWDFGHSKFAWQITPEQTEQGLRWLNLPKIRKQLTESQKAILDEFSHFLFVDVQALSTRYRRDSAPVYRVCSHSHGHFDYVPRPWRSDGIPFEVVS
jgi:hypothetical protein